MEEIWQKIYTVKMSGKEGTILNNNIKKKHHNIVFYFLPEIDIQLSFNAILSYTTIKLKSSSSSYMYSFGSYEGICACVLTMI